MDKTTTLLEGLKDRSVDPRDKSSFENKGGKVDDDAVRKGVAETPKSLGPRKD